MVNVLSTITSDGKCRFCGHLNDLEAVERRDDCEYCSNGDSERDMGLGWLFGEPTDLQGAVGGETVATMTMSDHDHDHDEWWALDIDMTKMDMDVDNETKMALQGAVNAVIGSKVKLTFCSPAHSTGGASLHHEVTVAAERMIVEGVPANVQYDTGAEMCLNITEMVARLGL